MLHPGCFLFFKSQYYDVATLAIIHKEEFAKFGYRSENKLEIFKNCAIFWLATCSNLLSKIW